MIEENKEVEQLLKNISDGLTVLSLTELNSAIEMIVIKKRQSEKPKDIDRLFEVICSEYKITKKALFEKYSRGDIYQAKIVVFTIMNKTLGISKRTISKIFQTYPNTVNVGVKYFNSLNPEKFADDNQFLVNYQKCLQKFLQKLKGDL
jgi:hypothetical protein